MALSRRGFFRRAFGGAAVVAAAPIVGPSILTGSPYRLAAVPFTEFLTQTSFYDQMAAASAIMGRDMADVLELSLRQSIREAA